MQAATRATIQSVFDASNESRIHFGQVVEQLFAVHVESYQVDYRIGRATYYLPDGETLELRFDPAGETIADAFDAEAVRSAIRGAQQGRVMYPEFKRMTHAAGCVGYTVWLAGRHVSYVGRRGETHIERFPD